VFPPLPSNVEAVRMLSMLHEYGHSNQQTALAVVAVAKKKEKGND